LCRSAVVSFNPKIRHGGRSSISYLESDPSVNLRKLRDSVVKAVK
jgi:hypothetical protein